MGMDQLKSGNQYKTELDKSVPHRTKTGTILCGKCAGTSFYNINESFSVSWTVIYNNILTKFRLLNYLGKKTVYSTIRVLIRGKFNFNWIKFVPDEFNNGRENVMHRLSFYLYLVKNLLSLFRLWFQLYKNYNFKNNNQRLRSSIKKNKGSEI